MSYLKVFFLSFFLVATISSVSAQEGKKLVLTAEQSSGGKIIDLSGGKKAVTMDKSCEASSAKKGDTFIEWKLQEPLPAGWYHGIVEFCTKEGEEKSWFNNHLGVSLVTAQQTISVNIMENFQSRKDEPQLFEFWIYSPFPTTVARITPVYDDLWKYKRTYPVAQLSLEQVSQPSLDASKVASIGLEMKPDGTANLPCSLPPGLWMLKSPLTKDCTVTYEGEDGKSFQANYPFDQWKRPGSVYFFMGSLLKKLTFKTPAMSKIAELQHSISREQKEPLLADVELMKVIDISKTESGQLELIGSGLTGDAPSFPLLPMGEKTAVLTSWDDGKPDDLRCAEILNRLGYRPTFFLNNDNPAMKFLDKLEGMNGEIGSHCYHHPSLYRLTPERAAEECVSMRKVLEKALNHPVISFSYPNGYSASYDVEGDYVLKAVKAAGYWSCRTTPGYVTTVDTLGDLMTMKTDGFFGNEKDLDKKWEETRAKDGGIFHFWGHSWQIGKTDEQWKKFENFCAKFANCPDAWYASQGELSIWLWLRNNIKMEVTEKTPAKVAVKISRPWIHPYLSAKRPISLKVPDGVTKVVWQGNELPVSNGFVELKW
ncbi:MAG: hypothetical protein A2X48_20915 [Lentisphaerae bacterium GWF2_49_21]|nr:MAG: hypothetical protein A2X48_20915 [Lentisphaerae bacterium GWF2_49_21]